MSDHRVEDPVDPSADDTEGSRTARTIRRLAVPILLLWVGVAALTNIVAPQLEVVRGGAFGVAERGRLAVD